jgi:hypothetical protein
VKPTADRREVRVNGALHVMITAGSRQAHEQPGHAGNMSRTLASLALLSTVFATGCLVLPATKTTTRSAGIERSEATHGRIKATKLQTGSSRTDVRVRATSIRECHREVFAVTEVTKSKRAKLGVDDPRGRALGVVLAPVTIPISALITGLVVASSDKQTTRITKPLRTETEECTTDAAGLALELQFPSGHVHRGKTDANGVLIAAIPIDEPYVGSVTVRGANTTSELHYEQQVPPITATRIAIESCRAQYQVTGITLKLTIDERGHAARVWLSAGDDHLAACVTTKMAGVVFPRALRGRTVVLPFEAPTT